MREVSRRRAYAVLPLALVTPLGFACKAFEGSGAWWFRNHGAGLLYEVFWILAAYIVLPTRRASRIIPAVVFCATTLLELLQLSQAPVLQAVRTHAWGRMLIGTTFAWWDIPHYAAGCVLGWLLLEWIRRRSGPGPSSVDPGVRSTGDPGGTNSGCLPPACEVKMAGWAVIHPSSRGGAPLRCRKCGRRNAETANFCSHCGATLQRSSAPRASEAGRRGRLALVGLLVVASALLVLWRLSPAPVEEQGEGRDGAGERGGVPVPAVREGSPGKPASEPPGTDGRGLRDLVAGEVTVAHHLGLELASVPAAVVSDRWIALPVRACFGGDRWRFRGEGGRSLEVVSGAWRDGDPVALWRLEEGAVLPGPDLLPWRPERPLTWRSLVSDRRREGLAVQVVERSERMVFVEPETPLQEPGVYTQAQRVVGWTFGPWLDTGALWTGPPGRDLHSDIRVDHFYSVTFANGREERFIRAIALGGEASPLERLERFAEGFRVPPELAPDQTVPILRGDEAAERMREIAADLLEKGFAKEVADILDTGVLLAAGDADLAIQSLRAASDYYGMQAAIDLAEGLLGSPDIRIGAGAMRLREQTRRLSVGWIRDHLARADTLGAWRAYKRVRNLFPDDPEIRLLGVEIALEDGDWRAAQGLLPESGVPGELAERAARLAGRAAQLEAEEGKIVIRFQAGLRRIPVRATLNRTVEQEFVIDTGASLVTIPTATAGRLGLRIDESTPERWVSTAGGPVLAKEVTLASVELEERTVRDVRAWVLDIPGHPETGLLGLNYLNRFHVEIDNGRGVLMLTPR